MPNVELTDECPVQHPQPKRWLISKKQLNAKSALWHSFKFNDLLGLDSLLSFQRGYVDTASQWGRRMYVLE